MAPEDNDLPASQRMPVYFDNVAIDNLISVVLELGAATWVNRDRLRIVEKLLSEKGVVTSEMIEKYVPTDEEREATKAERDAFVNRLYGAFSKNPG